MIEQEGASHFQGCGVAQEDISDRLQQLMMRHAAQSRAHADIHEDPSVVVGAAGGDDDDGTAVAIGGDQDHDQDEPLPEMEKDSSGAPLA